MFSGESKFEDRDRRWKAIRNMMKKHDLDCLILPGASGFGTNYAQYVSNQGRVAVVFPIEGEPTIFNIGWTSLMRIRERLSARAWGGEDWKTLYLTARTSLYCVKLNISGVKVS